MEEKRLARSSTNQVIGGVAAGFANYTNSDPLLWRILFVLSFFVGGGILIYIILWIVLPLDTDKKSNTFNTMEKQQESNNSYDEKKKNKNEGNLWGGIILIVLGSIFLIDRFVDSIDFGDLWPVILIAIGAILLFKSVSSRE